jgi:hypothetical protein
MGALLARSQMLNFMCDRAKELAEFDYDASIQEASDRLRFQQEIGSSAW